MDLSVCIVNYNVREQLGECLQSIIPGGSPPQTEVIVVDNASADDSPAMIQERFPWVRLVRNPSNLGFARAANQAMRLGRGRYLLVLNPDSVLVGDCLRQMVEFMDARPECGAATCRAWLDRGCEWVLSNWEVPDLWWEVLFYTATLGRWLTPRRTLERYWQRRWHAFFATDPTPIEFIQGSFIIIRPAALATVGDFDKRFFMYYEDIDWSRRLLASRWAMYLYPGAGVVHHSNQSGKQTAHSVKMGYLRRSQRRYVRKHFGLSAALAVRLLLAADTALSRWHGGRIDPLRAFPGEAGGAFQTAHCPAELRWNPVPGTARYLVELSHNPLFLGVASRIVDVPAAPLPREAIQALGLPRGFWRAIPCQEVGSRAGLAGGVNVHTRRS